MINLDCLPTRIPLNLFNGVCRGFHFTGGDQSPLDGLIASGCFCFFGQNGPNGEIRFFRFRDGRFESDFGKTNRQDGISARMGS